MNCEECKELLVGYVEGFLEESQKQTVAGHLMSCRSCRAELEVVKGLHERLVTNGKVLAQTDLENGVMSRIVREQSVRLKTTSKISKAIRIRRILMKNLIVKLAVAAAIIVAAVIAIHQFGGPISGTSVVWAEVARKVEQIQTFSCRVRGSMIGDSNEVPSTVEIMVYDSSKYGSRMDTYVDGKLTSITYAPAGKNEIVVVIPEAKKYSRMSFTEEQFKQMEEKQKDPREFLKLFLSIEHTGLGRSTIDGIKVEGIKVDSPKVGGGMFESAVGRLWVNVDTKLPVLMEIDGVSGGGSIQQNIVMDKFKWAPELDASLFEPNIPADYTLMAEMELPQTDEATAIEGLRSFAELTDGRYPSSLAMTTAMKEQQQAWKQKYERPPTNEELQKFLSLNGTCGFYAQLVQQDKDVEYYGDKVTAKDKDAVLMRWRISDTEDKVIYGDLTVKTVGDKKQENTKKEANEVLDKALKISGKNLSSDERGTVMRMLTLNEKDLIKGLGAFRELSGGKYPSKLDAKTTIKEMDGLGKNQKMSKNESKEKALDIFFASAFYENLVRQKKDVAYYGDKVTAEDSTKVLIRWKTSDNEYRVIFGDLHAETVTPEKLADLEAALPK
jgi:outer membrane lipoprotein-sorting protein